MKERLMLSIILILAWDAVCPLEGQGFGSGAGGALYTYNTSARFEGMGSAGVAAPWGGATNHWANPAQLAFRHGLQWESFGTKLAQGLADDIRLDNDEFIIGLDGVGLIWSGWPGNGLYLDMGDQEGTDENGNPTGVFHSYLKSRSLGLAADLVRVYDYFQSRKGPPRGLSRYAAVSFGYVNKQFEDQLTPAELIQDPQGGGTAQAGTYDLGWLVRATPVNTLDRAESLGFLLAAAYGSSTLNGGDEFIPHEGADQDDPLPRAHVQGWSVHGEVALSETRWRSETTGILNGLYHTFNPLLSFSIAWQEIQPGYLWDNEAQEYVYERDKRGLYDEVGSGWELGLANILFVRRGHLEITSSDIDGTTKGWGVNLQAADKFGLRYDRATVPQARGIEAATRETWLVWVCPRALLQD